MAQWVNVLVALLESLGLVLSTSIKRLTTAALHFQGTSTLICPLQAQPTHPTPHALVPHLNAKAVIYHVQTAFLSLVQTECSAFSSLSDQGSPTQTLVKLQVQLLEKPLQYK